MLGLECIPITIEVDIAGSWPGYQIVGLPDAAIQEAKERIRTAWKNAGLQFPSNSRIIINLAPADVRKEGAGYDLPIALAMYLAHENIAQSFDDSLFIGELALDGSLRHTPGILSLALFAKAHHIRNVFVPAINAREATLVNNITVYPVDSFQQLIQHITNTRPIIPLAPTPLTPNLHSDVTDLDMAYIKGQEFAKRALEIAASGGHNIIMSGPPGSGKTLLARSFASILPRLTSDEALEVTKIYSVAGILSAETPLITDRPFRSPHHSASGVALVGGGKYPRPGEISLAHRGVLFLDEFPEFPRSVLETLRQPLEDGVVTISRAQGTLTFPARFILVASQNPCPCGYASDPDRACSCSAANIIQYQKKISGPLLDRIDLHVEVPRMQFEKLANEALAESSSVIRTRVEAARERQYERFRGRSCLTNSDMRSREIKEFCALNESSVQLLKAAVTRLHISARSYHRLLKLARTIADLSQSDSIQTSHLAEALQYRAKQE